MDEAVIKHPINKRQHGLKSDRSTETAISSMTNYIEEYIMSRRHCIGIFLDIKGAFDSISPEHIREELLRFGGDEDMIKWYYDYLTRRDMQITMHNSTYKASV